MKQQIFLIFLVLGVALAAVDEEKPVEKSTELPSVPATNVSRCIYSIKEEQLSCQDGIKTIECDASIDVTKLGWSHPFNIFGIKRCENVSEPESVRFVLYPRDLDNATYVESEHVVDGTPVNISLFFDEKKQLFPGVRIRQASCFEKLVKLFSESTVVHEVKIGENKVSLVSEILVMDKHVHKRWLWGFGFFPWSFLWGWNAFGFPLFG